MIAPVAANKPKAKLGPASWAAASIVMAKNASILKPKWAASRSATTSLFTATIKAATASPAATWPTPEPVPISSTAIVL